MVYAARRRGSQSRGVVSQPFAARCGRNRLGPHSHHAPRQPMRRFALLFAFLIACVSPAAAADDVAAAQSIIRSQVEAFARDDAVAAYSYAAPGIHERFPEADIFLGIVRNSYARSIATRVSNSARRVQPTAKSPSRFTSWIATACPGKRSTRSNSKTTAASRSRAAC